MIFFDWDKVIALSSGKPKKIVALFIIHTYNIKIPKRKKNISRFFGKNLEGDSFLLNPKEILENKLKIGFEDIALYLELASQRNYLDYKWQGIKTLPLRYTEINRGVIEEHPLLELDDQDNIKFYYEERYNVD